MRIAIVSIKHAAKTNGSEVRNYYLYQGLKKSFNASYFIPELPVNLPEENIVTRILLLLQGKVPYIEYNRQGIFNKSDLNSILNSDIIQLQELESYFVLEKYLPKTKAKIVLDAHNVEYHRFISNIETSSFLFKLLGKYVSEKIKKLEIEAIKKVDYILACSKIDKEYFTKYVSENKIKIVPNGVKIDSFNQKTANTNNILFMGLLSYGPNSDAVSYYLKEIHPTVKKEFRNIKFTVIGKNPPEWLLSLAKKDDTIKVKGFVENIQDEFEGAAVCICPLRYGSGTRLKILEYMSTKKAVVTTSKGVEGLELKSGEHVLISDVPSQFAENIIKLLSSKKLRDEIGMNAFELVKEKYNWEKITRNLCKFYDSIL